MANTPSMKRLKRKLRIKNKNNKLPNLLSKLRVLKSRHEEVKDLAEYYEKGFRVALYDYCLDNNISFNNFYSGPSEEVEFKPSTSVSQNIKKIYRKIASLTHPDKIPKNLNPLMKEKLMNNFMKATNGIRSGFIFDVLEVAEKLDIEIEDIELSELTALHEELQFLEKEIAHNKNTYSWKWGETNDDIWIKKYLKVI